MQLAKNEVFLKEYQEFSSKIDKIADERFKKEMLDLLNKLLIEVRAVDRQHDEMFMGIKKIDSVDNHRENIKSIRKKLSDRLKN